MVRVLCLRAEGRPAAREREGEGSTSEKVARSQSGEVVRVQKLVTKDMGQIVVDEATLLVVRFSEGFSWRLVAGKLAARDKTVTINFSHSLSDLLPGSMEGHGCYQELCSLQALDSSRTAQSGGSRSNQCDLNGARRHLRFLSF